MWGWILLLYVAVSVLFTIMVGLFFSRICKRFPLPPKLAEKEGPSCPEIARPGEEDFFPCYPAATQGKR
jgi:hypothetical protein